MVSISLQEFLKSNKTLSEGRALNVANFLTEVGNIRTNRIEFIRFGANRPIATNVTKEGRALNRRIEILIMNEND
jgi:flagellar motor protein MotB